MRDADVGNGATISSDGRDSSKGGATFIALLATLRVGGGARSDNLSLEPPFGGRHKMSYIHVRTQICPSEGCPPDGALRV